MPNANFDVVGRQPPVLLPAVGRKKRPKRPPIFAAALLGVIVLGCLFAGLTAGGRSAVYMELAHAGVPPCAAYPFGTDAMGRDIFAMLWHGGRASLFIGLGASGISLALAALYGGISGLSCAAVDNAMTRFAEIAISIPSILLVLVAQALAGQSSPLSIALVIGCTGWMSPAKMVRDEVRRIRENGYVLASRCMNGGVLHILKNHLLPNLVPLLLFTAVTGVSGAIATEATLSFLGVGLPPEIVSWGSMLATADSALLSGDWWVIVIPGLFLAATLVCLTDLGNYLRKENNRGCGSL